LIDRNFMNIIICINGFKTEKERKESLWIM